jgi:hypothetical protein
MSQAYFVSNVTSATKKCPSQDFRISHEQRNSFYPITDIQAFKFVYSLYGLRMDDSSYRRNFNQDKKNELKPLP